MNPGPEGDESLAMRQKHNVAYFSIK